ncbi:two-component system sensor kinase [Streptomyces sp. e14]|nr:two-component system sensor kinase [Streptomyces sp. e14]
MPETESMTNAEWTPLRVGFAAWGPYGLLAVGVLTAAGSAGVVGMSGSDMYLSAALVVAALALELGRPWVLRHRPPRGGAAACLYFLRWAFGFVLTWLNPFFAFYAVIGYYTATVQLPRRLVRAGLALTAVTMAGSEIGGMPPRGTVAWFGFAVVLGVNIAIVSLFTRFADQEQRRAVAQAETIAELERTNTALQQALDENAALHAQLLVQAREAGVADERRRLAAEIHDTLAQGLTGIIAQLQVVSSAPDLTTARTHLERARGPRPAQPRRGPPLRAQPRPRRAGGHRAARGAEVHGRRVGRAHRSARRLHRHRHRRAAPRRGVRHAAAYRAGGPVQRRPARPRRPGRGHPVLHGRRGDPRHPRRRRRLRPGRRARPHPRRRLRPGRHARPRRAHRRVGDRRVRAGAGHGGLRSRTVGAP